MPDHQLDPATVRVATYDCEHRTAHTAGRCPARVSDQAPFTEYPYTACDIRAALWCQARGRLLIPCPTCGQRCDVEAPGC